MPRNSKKPAKKTTPLPWYKRSVKFVRRRIEGFLARRPHRSFRLTRRRDYVRPLELPGYFSFTNEVYRTTWRYRRYFLPLIALYLILYGVLVGISSQETYSNLSVAIQESGTEALGGDWGAFSQAGALLISVATSGLSSASSEAQQIFAVLITIMMWLTIVWLLRNKMAGHAVKLRDALYNSGAPLFASIVVTLVILVQLIPIAIAAIGYTAASSTGLLDGGVEAMLFWLAAGLLAILSLFWITSSLFSMVIITLPGMYPFRALKTSGDIVLGRRVRLLLRWVWMMLTVLLFWAIVLLVFIFIDMGIKALLPQISWLPIVPFVLLVLGAITVVWISVYIYLLYRKVVEYAAQ
jgi:hypothetical protein